MGARDSPKITKEICPSGLQECLVSSLIISVKTRNGWNIVPGMVSTAGSALTKRIPEE